MVVELVEEIVGKSVVELEYSVFIVSVMEIFRKYCL